MKVLYVIIGFVGVGVFLAALLTTETFSKLQILGLSLGMFLIFFPIFLGASGTKESK